MALRPSMPILVRDGDAFVQLIPEETMRLTVGIDHSDAAEVRDAGRGVGFEGEEGASDVSFRSGLRAYIARCKFHSHHRCCPGRLTNFLAILCHVIKWRSPHTNTPTTQ